MASHREFQVKVSRILVHHEYDHTMSFDTSYQIKDSSLFHLTELLSGNHQLIVDTLTDQINPLWPFLRQSCNNTYMNRYKNVDTTGYVYLSICVPGVPSYASFYTAYFIPDSGLKNIESSMSTITMHYYRTANLLNVILTTVPQQKNNSNIASDYVLSMFPNPFNCSTVITFTIPESDLITISIYNTLGQRVCNLVNRYFEIGKHSILWDASNYSTGIYFIHLKASSHTQVLKCSLIK